MNKGFSGIFLALLVIAAAVGAYFVFYKSEPAQAQTWVEIDPIQCLGNPWEQDWLSYNNGDSSKYPRDAGTPGIDPGEIQIIKNYYSAKEQIAVYDVRAVSFEEKAGEPVAVCQACSCPQGYTLYLLVSNADLAAMQELGYKVSDYSANR